MSRETEFSRRIKFWNWMHKLKHALVAIGSCTDGNQGVLLIKLSEEHWKPLYDDGFTPLQAAIESELNN